MIDYELNHDAFDPELAALLVEALEDDLELAAAMVDDLEEF